MILTKIRIVFNNILYTFVYYISCFRRKNNNKVEVESLIVSNPEIILIETSEDVDSNNLLKYLRHNIMYTDDTFDITYFEKPIFVRFKYLNETYQICLTRLESTKDCHSDIIGTPKYLSAVINDEVHITEKMRELHGHTKNFWSHIPDSISDFSVLFNPYKGKLHTFDMIGQNKIIEIS